LPQLQEDKQKTPKLNLGVFFTRIYFNENPISTHIKNV